MYQSTKTLFSSCLNVPRCLTSDRIYCSRRDIFVTEPCHPVSFDDQSISCSFTLTEDGNKEFYRVCCLHVDEAEAQGSVVEDNFDFTLSDDDAHFVDDPMPPLIEFPNYGIMQFHAAVANPVDPQSLNVDLALERLTDNEALHILLISMPLSTGPNSSQYCPNHGYVDFCRCLLQALDCDLPNGLTFQHISYTYKILVETGCSTLSVAGAPSQGNTPFEFMCALLDKPCKKLDDPTPDVYYKWCAIRTLGCFFFNWPCAQAIRDYEKELSRQVLIAMPILGIPQGLITEVFEHVTAAISASWSFVKYLPAFSKTLLSSFTAGLVSMGVKIFSGVMLADYIVDTVRGAFIAAAQDALDAVKGTVNYFIQSGLCAIFVKMIVRLFLGYTPVQLGLELVWDATFVNLIKEIIPDFITDLVANISSFVDFAVPQAPEAPLLMIIAALSLSAMSMFGGDYFPSPSRLSVQALTKMFSTAASLVSSGDKLGFGSYVQKLEDYLTSTDPQLREIKRWTIQYPCTVKFVNLHAEISAFSIVPPSLNNELRYFYTQHLREAAKFGDDRARLNTYTSAACRYMAEKGDSTIMATRLEPTFMLFAGEPGLGKSVQAKMLGEHIAKARLARPSGPPPEVDPVEAPKAPCRTIHDLIYNVNPLDPYVSRYQGQDIWYFDDWLQKNDNDHDPSVDVSLIFTLITAQPMALNMAAVSEKGVRANCDFVIGATNTKFWQQGEFRPDALRPHIKSIQDVSALRRRIKYIVIPEVQSPYVHSQGRITLNGRPLSVNDFVDPQILYRYRVFDSTDRLFPFSHDQPLWTWHDLQRLAYSEYIRAVDFVPIENDDGWSFLNQPVHDKDAVAEGFMDYIFPPSNKQINQLPDIDYELSEDAGCSSKPIFRSDVFLRSNEFHDNVVYNCECGIHDSTIHRAKGSCLFSADYVCFARQRVYNIYGDHHNVTRSKKFVSTGISTPASFVAVIDLIDDKMNFGPHWDYPINVLTNAGVNRILRHDMTTATVRKFRVEEDLIIPFYGTELRLKAGHVYLVAGVATDVSLLHERKISQSVLIASGVAGLATLSILAYASQSAARSLINAASRAYKNIGAYFTTGSRHFVYNADDDSYEAVPQAPNVIIKDGQRYVCVRLRNGAYRLYPEESWKPQSPDDNVFIRHFSKNARFNDQFPSIVNNLWAVVKDDAEQLCGSVLALGETIVLAPLHVANCMLKYSVSLRKDGTVLPLTRNIDDEVSFTVTQIGPDLACVHFCSDKLPSFRLPHAKSMLKKFSCTAQSGVPDSLAAVFAHRLIDGSLNVVDCNLAIHDVRIGYTHGGQRFEIPRENIRVSEFAGMPGACGGVYLHNGETNTDMIVGVHIAYLPKKRLSAAHIVDTKSLALMRSIYPGTSFVSENGPTVAGRCSVVGLPHAKYFANPSFVPDSKRGVTLFPDLTQSKYALAPIKPFYNPKTGIFIDPVLGNLTNIANSARSSRVVGPSLAKAVDRVLRRYNNVIDYEAVAPTHTVLPWQDVVSAASGLPHIDLNAACGVPFNDFNPQKRVFFDAKGQLLPDAIEFMDQMDADLVPDDWLTRPFDEFPVVDCICTSCPKSEPRPLSKAQIGKTRIFTVCPIQEFLLQRRYFLDFAKFLTDRNLCVHSALGVSQQEYGHLHANITPKRKVMTGDFDKFDQSFSARVIALGTRLILLWYKNKPGAPTRVVDPNLPPLDRDNFMRYRLLLRLAHFKALVGDEICQFLVSHPSGSFLTTILNIIIQSILWEGTFLELIGDEHEDHTSVNCLGDDSIASCDEDLCPPAESIAAYMKLHGFTITSDTKDGPPVWQDPWIMTPGTWSDYKFLSRFFGCQRYMHDEVEATVGLLDPDRLLKMLHFSDIKHMPENFPSQVVNFLSEVRLWFQVDPTAPVVMAARRVLAPFGEDFWTTALILPSSNIQLFVLTWLSQHPEYTIVTPQPTPFEDEAVAQSGEGSSETTFLRQADPEVEQPFDLSHGGVDDNMDPKLHDVQSIFKRPYRVAAVNWLKTHANGTQLHSATYPSTFFDNNFNAQAKLSNFAALRGTVVVVVTLSSSPFSQGLLLLSARPQGRNSLTEYEAIGDPSVILDAASGTRAEIRVPIVLPQGWSLVEFYSAANLLFDWCRISLTVLSALQDNGVAGAQISIFASLEDVELRNPTVTNFATAPQGLFELDSPGDKLAERRLSPHGSDEAIADDAVTKRIKVIGAYVRTYGGFLTDTVAILSVMGKFAIAAGLSKPSSETVPHFTSLSTNPSSHLMIGQSSAIRMATIASQKIALPPCVFGSEKDEMDIKHFVSRRGLMRRITWATSNASGTVLADWYITPGNGHCNVGKTSFYHSPLSFVASMFQLWRGGLEYEFLCSKTAFQSGQLEIIWQLGTAEAPVTKDSETANCYRVIWDLQDNSSLKVKLPFCSALKWCQIFINDDSSPTVPPAYNVNHTNGAMIIRVLNPLVNADATVSSNIDILVLVAGSPDIEFAVPYRQPAFNTFINSAPRPHPPDSKGKEPEDFDECEAQGGEVFQKQGQERSSAPIVLSSSSPHTPYGAVTHIGECIGNLRLLTRRMAPLTFNGFRTYSGGGSTNTYTISHTDLYHNHCDFDYLCFAFSFFSGGFRYWVRPLWGPVNFAPATTYMRRFTLSASYGYNGATPYVPLNTAVIQLGPDNPSAVVDVPYQNVVPFVPIHSLTSPLNCPPSQLAVSYTFYGTGGGALGEIHEEISAADDFTFGWQTGLPAFDYTPSVGVSFNWDTYV